MKQTKVINYDGLVVGEIYSIVSDHNHGGKKIKIEDISLFDNIIGANGKKYRNIHGRLLNSNIRINLIPLQIKEYYDKYMLNVDYSKLSKIDIIMLAKKNDKRAVIEFVKRFKKIPQIKR